MGASSGVEGRGVRRSSTPVVIRQPGPASRAQCMATFLNVQRSMKKADSYSSTWAGGRGKGNWGFGQSEGRKGEAMHESGGGYQSTPATPPTHPQKRWHQKSLERFHSNL